MANAPTTVTIKNKAGTQTVTIAATKVTDSLGNKDSVRYIRPNQTTPSANFYNLRRVDEMITVSGYITKTSSSVATDDTSREAAFRLRLFVLKEDSLTLEWGYASGSTGVSKITLTGFITQLSIEEHPQDIPWDGTASGEGVFNVTFSFSEGVSRRT